MQIIQVGINTADIAGSLRLYHEAFGFKNGGGQGLWGETLRVHGLEPDSRALMWWMVGGQEFCQLEFFHHTKPAQRPLPSDWRPCDIGWVRIGLLVADFDRVKAVLPDHSIPLLGEAGAAGARRMAFRDPFGGMIVEVRETPGLLGPHLLYAASSVSDLGSALIYYRDVLQLEINPLHALHGPGEEALWGLAGATCAGFVASAGDRHIEVVAYDSPVGRPQPEDFRISDQGIMNIALGTRSIDEAQVLLSRLEAAGHHPPRVMRLEGLLAGYIVDREREIEFAAIPREMDDAVGFLPKQAFFT
ncbi:MAG: hypothetical protein V4579_10305 [Pseudomonadota bacterium]